VTSDPLITFYPATPARNHLDTLSRDVGRMAVGAGGYAGRVDQPEPRDALGSAEIDRVLDRNWNELLQELRVAQTGTQILTGFLLTLPFSSGFPRLEDHQKNLYLVVLLGSVVATGLNVAPVAYHRILFRRHKRRWLVSAANVAARAALAMLALDSAAVVLLVFDVVVGLAAAVVAAVAVLLFLSLLWGAVALVERVTSSER